MLHEVRTAGKRELQYGTEEPGERLLWAEKVMLVALKIMLPLTIQTDHEHLTLRGVLTLLFV